MIAKRIALSVAIAALFSLSACIPEQNDWVDQGVVLKAGSSGSWDARLYGMVSPSTVIKKDGVYYLYYIGADGDRSTDGGPRHRALGVATSRDGIHFTKYDGNPVLKYLPHNNEEEGIFSAGAWLDDYGKIHLYYGAMDAGNATSTSVDGDVRLATSSDGLNFSDKGDVLRSADRSVWGYGDELFPVGAYEHAGTWHVYYLAKGSKGLWRLGLASGPGDNTLPHTTGVIKSGAYVKGGGDVQLLGDSVGVSYLLRDHGPRKDLEGYMFSPDKPADFKSPVGGYSFPQDRDGPTVFLDTKAGKAFLYVTDKSRNVILAKTATLDLSGRGKGQR